MTVSPWDADHNGMTTDDALALALEWAEPGFPAFPCALRDNGDRTIRKRPLTIHGHAAAAAVIEAYIHAGVWHLHFVRFAAAR